MNAVVTHNDPADFDALEGFFDVIVVDAPCSGSGLFRRDPEAMNEWSMSNVKLCAERQQRILADVWDALKEDGTLIYSTCSYSDAENESILEWMSDHFQIESLRVELSSDWGIEEVMTPKVFLWRY
jgi:16S rRNA C967 or C1407 C5-methylase (RsmB/RsmF family)